MTRKEYGHLTPAQMRTVEAQRHSGWDHQKLAEHWGIPTGTIQHVLEHRTQLSPVAFTWKGTS
jgi:plasmid maintenance system antidote protein VapI